MRDKRQEIIIIKQQIISVGHGKESLLTSQSHKKHEDARRTSGMKNAVLKKSASTSPKQGPLRYLLGYWKEQNMTEDIELSFYGGLSPGTQTS